MEVKVRICDTFWFQYVLRAYSIANKLLKIFFVTPGKQLKRCFWRSDYAVEIYMNNMNTYGVAIENDVYLC